MSGGNQAANKWPSLEFAQASAVAHGCLQKRLQEKNRLPGSGLDAWHPGPIAVDSFFFSSAAELPPGHSGVWHHLAGSTRAEPRHSSTKCHTKAWLGWVLGHICAALENYRKASSGLPGPAQPVKCFSKPGMSWWGPANVYLMVYLWSGWHKGWGNFMRHFSVLFFPSAKGGCFPRKIVYLFCKK